MSSKIFFILFFALALGFMFPDHLSAQVAIGKLSSPSSFSLLELSTQTVKGGLRLPHLTTQERDALTTAAFKLDPQAEGLTIYNTHTKCIEYWNKLKWVSLCKGSAQVDFVDGDGNPLNPTEPSFPPEGGDKGPFVPSENPPCTGQNPYSFTIVSGGSFTSVLVISENTGEFKVSMTPNNTALTRTAILRITNNCTQEYKELVFLQDGNTALCNTAIPQPTITATHGGVLCVGGAVYLTIKNPQAGATYLWTMNGVELGRGVFFTATQKGTYQVFVGGIGCMANASNTLTVSTSTTSAPANKLKLYASNGGVICYGATVQLTILNPSDIGSGTVTWYKNGEKTSKTGTTISVTDAEQGNWFVVMEEGACTSLPSDVINISVDETSKPLSPPVIHINGVPIASVSSFCSSGRLELLLTNFSLYTTAVTVNWFNGDQLLGSGERLSIKAPSTGVFMLRCVVKDNTGNYLHLESQVSL